MINKFSKLVTLATILLLAACSGGGNEFVSKWQNVKKKRDAIEIVRNGDDFLVLRTSKDLMTSKIPLRYEDDTLKLEAGFMSATLSYIKASDTLAMTSFAGVEEYRRVK